MIRMRQFVAAALVLTICLAVAGCGGVAAPAAPKAGAPAATGPGEELTTSQ